MCRTRPPCMRVCLGLVIWTTAAAVAASPNIVISQVYGGGGNSGAPYRYDFIELFNRSNTPVTMTNWSVQYTSATGVSWGNQMVVINRTLAPGQYFLIQLASGGSNGQALPTPDALGDFNISATTGKVALVSSSNPLPPVNCPGASNGVVDLVGYGASVDCQEGSSPAPPPSNTTAIERMDAGCWDTDENGQDFEVVTPHPRNSASAYHPCTGDSVGACCVGTTCYNGTTLSQCTDMGGSWKGAGTGCQSNPCGAATGACCVDGICTINTQQNCVAAGGTYKGNGTTCTPNPCLNCITIAEAKALGTGYNVRLCDVIISNKTDLVSSTSYKSFQVQHTVSGQTRGITVYGSNAEIDAVLSGKNEGDSINIDGYTSEYNGLFELETPANAVKTGSPGIPSPLVVTPADFADGSPTAEDYESVLVQVQCVMFTPPPGGAKFAANTSYLLMDTSGVTMVLRCTGGTALVGQTIPSGWLNIRGIFSQFDEASPYDGGYLLLPRTIADFSTNPGCGGPVGACCVGESCLGGHTAATCSSLGGVYKGDGTSCTPNPCVCEGIGAAKAAGVGKFVRICQATISNDIDLIASSSYKSMQLQDGTAAITVYGTNAEIDAILGQAFLYDKITLRGYTSEYNGLFELVAPLAFEANNGTGTVPTPVVVTGADFAEGSPLAEVVESQWVTVNCATFADGGGKFAGQTNYLVSDAYGSFTVRVSTNSQDMVGQTIPTGPVNITGLFSQYDTSAPYTGGYQLLLVSINDPLRLGKIEPNPNCGPSVGACCVAGDCTPGQTTSSCAALGGEYLGDGTGCITPVCPVPVEGGDIALGLSNGSPLKSTEHIRNSVKIGAWPSVAYTQAMEFDNSGVPHNACGNLLALDYGAGGATPGAPPSCTNPNRPEEAGKVYNLATDGTNSSQLIYDFNLLAGGLECTRVSGLSVSPGNGYLAMWGVDTGHLIVLAYSAGPDPGSGTGVPYITAGWAYAGLNAAAGSQGTTWYDADTILVYNTDYVPGWTKLNRVRFNGTSFTLLGSKTISVANTGGSMFTDVEYNPSISPYVFCLFSNYSSPTSSTYLTALQPANWSIVKTLDLSGVVETGREIALGPDGYLYISQHKGFIDRISVANPAGWTTADCQDYYHLGEYATFCGLDVAFACPEPTGACCINGVCSVKTQAQCQAAGGAYKGHGTPCTPDPCICRGDMNCDNLINFEDISPFVAVLSGATPCKFENCDVNADGLINFDDINPFVDKLSSGALCP